ncbi:hypothetical protein V502_06899 [Pseudogymnoascus sp. VKM F-4520 (FW-2644)]|nr:hypothetical protein V502_06899 [Pseudogymnoascus sp. VKM F-4520 (FW-2644)]
MLFSQKQPRPTRQDPQKALDTTHTVPAAPHTPSAAHSTRSPHHTPARPPHTSTPAAPPSAPAAASRASAPAAQAQAHTPSPGPGAPTLPPLVAAARTCGGDYGVLMLVHPLLDSSPDGRPLTDAITTLPTPTTLRSVKEILRQPLTIILRRVRRAEELAPIVAALVVLRPHKGLTLFIPRRALSARAAILVRGVTDGVVLGLEFARRGIAAGIVAAPGHAATIAVFAHLDDAVAALRAGNGRDVTVAGQTARFNGLPADGAADVADAAGREVGDAGAGRGVHDVFAACWAGVGGKGAALLRGDGFAVRAGGRVAVVDGAEGVAYFVGDDEPFRVRLDNDVGAGHGVVRA